jgi:hypothetical protein
MTAESCPNCGHRMKRGAAGWILVIIVVLVALGALSAL